MAMNKKEKEMVEELKTKLALRFTDNVEKDLDPPSRNADGIVNGYSFNTYGLRVDKSCSSSIYHSPRDWDKTTTQNTIRQYSTKLLALKALRNAVEKECAKKLRAVDVMIEIETNGGDQN